MKFRSPFVRSLGMEIVSADNGMATIVLELQPVHLNSWHVAHGAVLTALLDVVMSMALRSVSPAAEGVLTTGLKINFVTPGKGRLSSEGRVLHRGRTLSVCEGEIRDDNGTLVAKGMGSFMLRPRKQE